ncbi:MAG: phosphatase PAP2 family protein [Candidatus Ancaeobacter aquaticus]|nr:phosphatase PAP2 family protein [Candidatus Ancaeobacter aquaticus]
MSLVNYLEGYALIHWVQSFHSPFLDYFFYGITQFGYKYFYILAIVYLYWCIDKRFAVRIFYLFIVGVLANQYIKYFLSTPRPDPNEVRVIFDYYRVDPSFPSGHAQGSFAFWGFLMTRFRNVYFIICALSMIFFVSVSRLYLGAHYPIDILGGFILGALTIVLFLFFFKIYERIKMTPHSKIFDICLFVLVPLGLFVAVPTAKMGMFMGIITGFGVGAYLEKRYIGFTEKTPFVYQVIRTMVGLVPGVLIFFVGRMIPGPLNIRTLVVYAVAGFWVGFIYPYCINAFQKWHERKNVR